AAAGAAGRSVSFAVATRAAAATPYAALAGVIRDRPASAHDRRAAWFHTVAQAMRPEGCEPVVIGVDDAHLLDDGSAAMLLHLAASGAAAPGGHGPHWGSGAGRHHRLVERPDCA